LKCAVPACNVAKPDPSIETRVVQLLHTVELSCGDANIQAIIDNIDATLRDLLGSWPGVAQTKYACRDRNASQKRQSSSTISTEATLTGPDASTQATAVVNNVPASTSVNGVPVNLASATTDQSGSSPSNDDDGGLSGGAIAGIVIGSVFGALLVLVAAYFVVVRDGDFESV